jgi:hypothetical protein
MGGVEASARKYFKISNDIQYILHILATGVVTTGDWAFAMSKMLW